MGLQNKLVSKEKAKEISSRLHSGMSDGGRSRERKNRNIQMIKQERLKSEERVTNNK